MHLSKTKHLRCLLSPVMSEKYTKFSQNTMVLFINGKISYRYAMCKRFPNDDIQENEASEKLYEILEKMTSQVM